jgi:hypothetical protein
MGPSDRTAAFLLVLAATPLIVGIVGAVVQLWAAIRALPL